MDTSSRRNVTQQQSRRTDPWAGWDIGLAAFALACMTSGFWRLWPGALSLTDAPLGPMILKAGLAALGFVAIATRWEDALRAISRNPLVLVLMALACSSTIWAIVPADTLRNSIMLIVIWVFGVALVLRFKARELAEICGFAGLFGLIAQFAAHQGMPPVIAFDGDVAFAIVGSTWAALCVPSRRPFWLFALGACCLLAFAARDFASLGAGIGLVLGIGVAKISHGGGRQGTISVIVTAWVLVGLIIGVTLFALFGADPVSAKISNFFSRLGPHMIIGQGFGGAGHSVGDALGTGLGVVGVALAGLVVFATLFQALLGERQSASRADGSVAMWLGALGAMIVSPAQIAIFGPIAILFAASSFAISLSCVAAPRQRQALMKTALPSHTFSSRNVSSVNYQARTVVQDRTAPTLNAMGLRPKS